MRRLAVILGILFSSLLLLPTAASAATAIEYGVVTADWPWD